MHRFLSLPVGLESKKHVGYDGSTELPDRSEPGRFDRLTQSFEGFPVKQRGLDKFSVADQEILAEKRPESRLRSCMVTLSCDTNVDCSTYEERSQARGSRRTTKGSKALTYKENRSGRRNHKPALSPPSCVGGSRKLSVDANVLPLCTQSGRLYRGPAVSQPSFGTGNWDAPTNANNLPLYRNHTLTGNQSYKKSRVSSNFGPDQVRRRHDFGSKSCSGSRQRSFGSPVLHIATVDSRLLTNGSIERDHFSHGYSSTSVIEDNCLSYSILETGREASSNAVSVARNLLRIFHHDHPAGFHRWDEVSRVMRVLYVLQQSVLDPMLAQLTGDLHEALQVACLTSGYEELERHATYWLNFTEACRQADALLKQPYSKSPCRRVALSNRRSKLDMKGSNAAVRSSSSSAQQRGCVSSGVNSVVAALARKPTGKHSVLPRIWRLGRRGAAVVTSSDSRMSSYEKSVELQRTTTGWPKHHQTEEAKFTKRWAWAFFRRSSASSQSFTEA